MRAWETQSPRTSIQLAVAVSGSRVAVPEVRSRADLSCAYASLCSVPAGVETATKAPTTPSWKNESGAIAAAIQDALPYAIAELDDDELVAAGMDVEQMFARCEVELLIYLLDSS